MLKVEEMIEVVENYIYKKKGVRANITINYHPFLLQRHLDMLNYAYHIAIDPKAS